MTPTCVEVDVESLDYGPFMSADLTRLFGVSPAKLRHWRDHRNGRPPIIGSHLEKSTRITWGEFIEAGHLLAWQQSGNGLANSPKRSAIDPDGPYFPCCPGITPRQYAEQWARVFPGPYPLARLSYEDLGSVAEAVGVDPLYVFAKVKHFAEWIEFDADGVPLRYWPAGRGWPIKVDPKVKFGRPTIQGTGVTTEIIAEMAAAGDDPAELADCYDINQDYIEAAIKFEEMCYEKAGHWAVWADARIDHG